MSCDTFDRHVWPHTCEQDVSSLVHVPDPEDVHIAGHFIAPNEPKTKLYRLEEDCCGTGWSSGLISGYLLLLHQFRISLLSHCCVQ